MLRSTSLRLNFHGTPFSLRGITGKLVLGFVLFATNAVVFAQTIQHGIDVSDYQGNINWSQVAAGKKFAFVKATSGLNGNQSYFAQNIQAATAAGIKTGAYHFAYPNYTTANTGTAEAQHFLAVAKPYISTGYLRPALDMEDAPGQNSYPGQQLGKGPLSQWIRDFASEVKRQTGVDIMIYSPRDYARHYFTTDLSMYAYWVPTNDGNEADAPYDMGIWGSWAFKQYRFGTDSNGNITATCPGVSGGCDLDSFNGDLTALNSYVIGGVVNPPTITSVSPRAIGLIAGDTFPISYTINVSGPRTVILGASLYPAGQTTGRMDDPAHDSKITLPTGQSIQQRQFTIPAGTAQGTYDLAVALWDDVNNNSQIDAGDQQLTLYTVANAVWITLGCSYSLSSTSLDLTSGGASSEVNVATGSSCSWTATPDQSWISITTNGSGTGSLQVTFSVTANTSSSARTGHININGQAFTITQAAASSNSQNVTVSNVLVSPPSSRPGFTPTFYADINSPVTQSVLFGASIVLSGTSTLYNDSAHDKAATVFAGQTQYNRLFTIPTNAPTGTYDVIFGVWADNNGNGQIDNTIDTMLGSFTAYGALTVQPPLGTIHTTLMPQGAIDAGAQWRADGGNWLGSGFNLQVAVGNHIISFQPVSGRTTPPDQIVSVQTNQTTQVTGTYFSVTSTVSQKTHGTGTFNITLPLTGNPGIECRSGGAGGDHQVVFTFANSVSVGGLTITSKDGTATGSLSVSNQFVTVNLHSVANAQIIGIRLNNVNDGTNAGDVSISMAVLAGDTNGDGAVNSGDISQTKSQSGNTVTSSNFREDVTTDGSINSGDISLVKSKSGTALP